MPADTPLLLWGPGNLLWGRLSSLYRNTPHLCSSTLFLLCSQGTASLSYCYQCPVCLSSCTDRCQDT